MSYSMIVQHPDRLKRRFLLDKKDMEYENKKILSLYVGPLVIFESVYYRLYL